MKWNFDTDMWNLKKAFDDLDINYVVIESGPQYENDPLLHHLLYVTGPQRNLNFKDERTPFYFENYKLVTY